ncbi:flagellar export protein FliJ [Desulforhabdus amnigena]|jgi:flagellar export protein FliJ|uniref:Flagellar FliJ protein n=1 Tax=Desulforhabdus amnigena TaxID=40218 RepID=A0A9W6CXD6_9BACT|nr:flagellar export protein FliJ [Desulforhabdus amnigena]NLJ26606.1 flagellar export protein FliJ [Deltaproteobacteria bacterium]GLI33586.1 hypothetical protein DAMNIGENAA_10190 [Desulforhabdus amnigena]
MIFQFRFEALLKQRQFNLKKCQSDLAVVQCRYQELKSKELEIIQQIAHHAKLCEDDQSRGMNVAAYLCFKDYGASLARQLQNLRNELMKASQEVEEKKGALLECEKAVKMLECLEEKELQEHRYLQAHKEQKELDEISILKGFHEKD